MMVFFRTRLGKTLIWQKKSWMWESDFKRDFYPWAQFQMLYNRCNVQAIVQYSTLFGSTVSFANVLLGLTFKGLYRSPNINYHYRSFRLYLWVLNQYILIFFWFRSMFISINIINKELVSTNLIKCWTDNYSWQTCWGDDFLIILSLLQFCKQTKKSMPSVIFLRKNLWCYIFDIPG